MFDRVFDLTEDEEHEIMLELGRRQEAEWKRQEELGKYTFFCWHCRQRFPKGTYHRCEEYYRDLDYLEEDGLADDPEY
jgi:hypothetical protein